MPIIRLPDALRDVITSALDNDLGRRIEKGRAVAILTYQCAETGENKYLVEFKSAENAKTLACYQGNSKGTKTSESVPLYPDTTELMRDLADNVDIGEAGFVLQHTAPTGEGAHDFRVEFTPPGSSAVYLALEAKASEGESVPMQRAELYPVKG